MTFKPSIKPGIRLYAVGDVHGCFDLLQQMLNRIKNDVDPDMGNTLIFLGDYIDRGPDSRRVMEFMSKFKPKWIDVVTLKGNHEDTLLKVLHNNGRMENWLEYGGRETLLSYGVDTDGLNDITFSSASMQRARLDLRSVMPGHHLDFLASMKYRYEEGDFIFVHAGVRPGVSLDEQADEDLIWIRSEFLDCNDDFGKIVVHGHSITSVPEVKANRIGIDTGASRSGLLTALVLEGSERRFLST